MIPRTLPLCQEESWQQTLAQAIRDPKVLFARLELDPTQLPESLAASADFPLRVPEPYLARMRKGDWADPLLRQVLPLGAELAAQPGFSRDPLEEMQQTPLPGLLHKYHGRVLLMLSAACAINCRYCFRRHFPYQENTASRGQWQAALDYIAADHSINEIILSGGDPLAVSDRSLSQFVSAANQLTQIKRLRIHSRLPIVIPQRINQDCLRWMAECRAAVVLVLHCNHPRELDSHVARALSQLREQGVTLLNQSVLLHQINDQADIQVELSERLFDLGVQPYYLHLLDRVRGAAHFEVSEERARALYGELHRRLPGYLIPKLVRESAHAISKLPVLPVF